MNRYDIFETPISFNYPDGSYAHQTSWGSCLSIFLILVTFLFFVVQFQIMMFRKGTNVSNSTLDSYFLFTDTFTQEKGFHIAFGLDKKYDDYLDISVKIKTFNWLKDEFSTLELQLYPCSDADIAQFYPVKVKHKK